MEEGRLQTRRAESLSDASRREPLDVETAWDLANIRGFLDATEVDDHGNVDGMDNALERVLDRYPWLADEPPYDPDEDDEEDPSRPRRTARPPHKRTDAAAKQHQSASLRKRFPALAKSKGG